MTVKILAGKTEGRILIMLMSSQIILAAVLHKVIKVTLHVTLIEASFKLVQCKV